jgi:hypothetical protein
MSKSRGLRRRHRNRAKLKLARKLERWAKILVAPLVRRTFGEELRGIVTVTPYEPPP